MEGDFKKLKQGNRTFYVRSQFINNDLTKTLLSGKEQLWRRYNPEMIPASEFARVYKFYINVDGVEKEVYLKQFLNKGGLKFIKTFFCSRAKRTLEAELMLARHNFDVPETLAIGEQKDGLFDTTSFLMTSGIADSKLVFQFIRELPGENREIKLEMIRVLGKTIGKMHAQNIFHGDLRLNNVLVRQEGGKYRFFFLDNERTRKFRKLPFRLRLKNLVQANIVPRGMFSKTDLMRFFREYCAEARIGKGERRNLIASILKKTGRRLNKRNRTRRKLKKTVRTKAGDLWIEAGNYKGIFGKDFGSEKESQDFIVNFERLTRTSRVIKEDGTCIISQIKWNNREMTVKQYFPKGFIDSFRQTTGKSDAKTDWLNGHRHKAHDTSANKPLACIEWRKSGLVWKSFYVTEYNGT